MSELDGLTIAELAERLRSKQLSPVELAAASIDRAQATEPALNSFITITGEQAMVAAHQAEAEIAAGNYRGPLHGIPFVTKDLFWTKGVRTTSGSRADEGFVPDEDATVVRLLREAGAFSIGKTNMSEWAFSITGYNTHFGWPNNPWALDRMPAGSSSGTGSAVTAGVAPMGLGTDTGGSIRAPASFCGLTGLKPTYGLVSRHGVTPLSWSLDHAGPLAHTAEDVALTMDVLARHDPRDPFSARPAPIDFTTHLRDGVAGLRIGVPREYVWDVLDGEVEASVREAIATLERLGATVVEASVPELAWASQMGGVLTVTESAAYHGERVLREGDLYDQRTRRRIESGLFISAATYHQAQRVRTMVGMGLARVFGEVDLLATPTMPVTALPQEIALTATELNGESYPTSNLMTRLTQIFNVNGHPALSAPCGFSTSGLPIGLQLVGRPFEDALVVQAAHAYQGATDWHARRPLI
jgi:aspartyl-tRNA(Asn)/glutamyl-tRNA(Gln) amidotransferase subunit A